MTRAQIAATDPDPRRGREDSWCGELEAPVLGGLRTIALEPVPSGIAVATPPEPASGIAHLDDDSLIGDLGREGGLLSQLAVDVSPRMHAPFRLPLGRLRGMDRTEEFDLGGSPAATASAAADPWGVVGVLRVPDAEEARQQLTAALADEARFEALPWLPETDLYRQLSRETWAALGEMPLPHENLTAQALRSGDPGTVLTQRFLDASASIQARMLADEKAAALLAGAAGVGKSTLMAAMAGSIAHGRVCARLRGTTLIELDSSVLSRAGKPDQDPSNQAILLALRALAGLDVIVVVDEAHALETSHNRNSSALTALKPLITRWRLRIVLATNEADRLRGWDDAIDSRLGKPIVLREASRSELAEEILPAKAAAARARHGIDATEAAIEAAIGFSDLLGEAAQPRSAVDVLDGARAWAEAAGMPRVTARLIQAYAWERLGRDARISYDEDAWVEAIARHVVGHRRAIRGIVRRLIAHELRLLRPGDEPIVEPFVVVLAGMPGIGKTSLTDAFRRVCAPGEEEVFTVEGADFPRYEHLSRLLGSPPGYVGHGGDGGQLVRALKNQSKLTAEFSESEEACPELTTRVIRPMLTGKIVSNEGGQPIQTRSTLIFLTTNAGSVGVSRAVGYGSGTQRSTQAQRLEAIRRVFPDRVWSRIGDSSVVLMDPLSRDEMLELVHRLLEQVQAHERLTLHVEAGVPELLLEAAEGERKDGVPALKRAVEIRVHQPLLAWMRTHRDARDVLLRPGGDRIEFFHVDPETGEFHD